MQSCQCLHQLRPFSRRLITNDIAGAVIKRFYASENPKWTSQAEEQFLELFKLKEKPPKQPKSESQPAPFSAPPPPAPPSPTPPDPPARKFSSVVIPTLPPIQTPPPLSPQPIRPLRNHQPSPLQPPPLAPPRKYSIDNLASGRRNSGDTSLGIPNISETYASALRIRRSDARPEKPFETLEASERAPQLSDEKGSIIKMWIEGLPVTDPVVIEEGFNKLAENRNIRISGIDVVTDRGMIATKSMFVTVDFGDNDREKIFYQLENFGLTIKGMRCPVRTAEVKRSLTLIELGQISEDALVEALKQHDIPYATYDYPGRYNSPQRQIAFPYRGSVILTFRSHAEAYDTKRRFDSDEGIMVGEKRIYALWGPRAGAIPLETRTSANYIRNLIWENRDLRAYATKMAQFKDKIEEAKGIDMPKIVEEEEKKAKQREAALDDIKQKLEEARQALAEAKSRMGDEDTTEEIKNAEAVIEEGKKLEAQLEGEIMMEKVHTKDILYEIAETRTLSPRVPIVEDSFKVYDKVQQTYSEKLSELEERHRRELRELKEKFIIDRKRVTRAVHTKNHRDSTKTAEELGIKKALVQKDVKLKSKKKRPKIPLRKVQVSDGSENTETSETSESTEGETAEGVATEANGEVESAESSGETESVEESGETESVEESGETESVEESGDVESSETPERDDAHNVEVAERDDTHNVEAVERDDTHNVEAAERDDAHNVEAAERGKETRETEESEETHNKTREVESEEDFEITEVKGTEHGHEETTPETLKTSSVEVERKDTPTTKPAEKTEGDTTVIVDSNGNERVAKVIDWNK